MENGANGMKLMGAYAVGLVSLAAICLTGIAVVIGFRDVGLTYTTNETTNVTTASRSGLVDYDTANYFIAGLMIFGTFAGVLALGMVGKIIINLFKSGQ
jgi:hypothetical protein